MDLGDYPEGTEREFTLDKGPFDGVTVRLPSILRVIVLQDLQDGKVFHRYEWKPGQQIGREVVSMSGLYRAFVKLAYTGATDRP